MPLKILPIPAFKDNYIWTLVDENSQAAWVVDPGEARNVIDFLTQSNLELKGILLTHHHPDHSGGIPELLKTYKKILAYAAHNYDNAPISVLSIPCKAFAIPGHTLDHIAFYLDNALFCGDTLFSVGCGKVFEGTAQQMFDSLNKLAQLPDETRVYCGHEYTLANLRFACHVDPENKHLQKKLAEVTIISQQNGCTLPAILGDEKKVNPFLRCTAPEIIAAVEKHAGKKLANPVEVFHHLREWKNNF